jgi:hypothetical protein
VVCDVLDGIFLCVDEANEVMKIKNTKEKFGGCVRRRKKTKFSQRKISFKELLRMMLFPDVTNRKKSYRSLRSESFVVLRLKERKNS